MQRMLHIDASYATDEIPKTTPCRIELLQASAQVEGDSREEPASATRKQRRA
jgi:hypothetical protein